MKLALTLVIALLAVACKEAKNAHVEPEPDACGPTASPGDSVLVDCAEAIELEIGSDGFPLQIPEGSTCEPSASYRLELETRTLTFRECEREGGPDTRWVEHEGTRELSNGDYEHLLDTLTMIEVQAPSSSCGADKSTVTVSVETDNGSQDYVDAFYACRGDENTYVAPVDPAAALFATLAFEEPVLCCDAIAHCDHGETHHSQEECEGTGQLCESRTICCDTVWCTVGEEDHEQLDASEAAWSSLVEEHGDTYWYRTSTCGQGIRDVTWVQVTDGAVSLVAREREEDAPCTADEPYVYATFDGRTLDALYDECEQVRTYTEIDDSSFSVDEDGVVRTCWVTESGCSDACDDGFYIAERGFGVGDFGDATPD